MTMELGMVGCGGMGLRHIQGYIEHRKHFDSVHLAAVCDLHRPAAEHVAGVVEEALGDRPEVYTNFEEMLGRKPALDAVDIVTDTRAHHTFALSALDAGLHVMTEKPIGITLAASRRMREAAMSSGLTLAVAENFRRDPMNRLAKAVLASGVIGTPAFMVRLGVGGGDTLMHNTGWRALKQRAGSHILENGVHDADLILYFMGDVSNIYAETDIVFRQRRRAGVSSNLAQYYGHRVENEFADQQEIRVNTEDSAFAVLRFASGAMGQLTLTSASQGYGVNIASVHGSDGTLLLPPSRTGKGPELRLPGREDSIQGQELLSLVPDFHLDDMTARLWNGESRLACYEMPFEEIDRKLVAIEYQDFAEAVESGREPEVGHAEAMKALGLAYGLLESGYARRSVTMDEVIEGEVHAYQREIDEGLGL